MGKSTTRLGGLRWRHQVRVDSMKLFLRTTVIASLACCGLAVVHASEPRQQAHALTNSTSGTAAAAERDWKSEVRQYQRAIALHPEACDGRFDLAKLELKHEQAQDAEKQLHFLLEHCPANAAVNSALGSALLAEGNADTAGEEFKAALSLDAADFAAQYNLGVLALDAGDFQAATDRLKAAAGLHPKDADVRVQLAGAYAQLGQPDDATEQLLTAIRLAPDNAAYHALLSQVLAGNGHLSMAIDQQRTALRLGPDDADGWNNLGVMQARQGDTIEAREDFLHALRLNPNHAQAQANLQHLPG